MAEHSMCQPGRPRPNGVGQEAVSGSPGLALFHSAKSRGSRLVDSPPSPEESISLGSWWVSAPYSAKEGTSNHTSPLPLDRKSTRLNSSHVAISYAVFCLNKKNK